MRVQRVENKKRIKRLLSGMKSGLYNKELILISDKQELERGNKSIQDLDSFEKNVKTYKKLLEELDAIEATFTKKTDLVRSLVNIKGLRGEGLAFVKSDQSEISVCFPLSNNNETIPLSFKVPVNCSTVSIGNLLYIIGGDKKGLFGLKTFLTSVHEINLDNGLARSLKALKKPRRRAAAVSIGRKEIYIMGGDMFTEQTFAAVDFFDVCEKFSVAKNEWTACSRINKARTNISAGTLEDRFIYLFGGHNKNESDVNLIECLDTANPNHWKIIKLENDSYWVPTQTQAVMQISSDELLLFGGKRNENLTNQALIFKVSEKKFERIESMKEADSFLQQYPKMIFGAVYAFGCHSGNLHVFDVGKRTWSLNKEACKPKAK
eukprot:TRINITY_DN9050_c0_g1_i8.p1 TRINITY_DN9050_c0_g1~~TRINITY_DN9050_c0_g1_i8.p1  ORF type:complete len:378 (-),score=117.75 TRINITY_DN9050_c0_g1_i8:140-1273(-)